MSPGIEIREGRPEDDAERDALVERLPEGTFFHLSGWRRSVERIMGHRGVDLLAFDGDRMCGVLPLVSCRGLRGGKSWISMPYAVYGGPVGERPEIVTALYAEAERRAVQARVGRLELRCLDELDLGASELESSDLYATFIKDLPDEVDGVLAGMPKKSRAEARKARTRHGLELS